jgi:CBS domain-containing protein
MMKITELMQTDVARVDPHASLREAARLMRDKDVGDVVVAEGTQLRGIITDRDLAIRGIAESLDPETAEVGDLASAEVKTLTPSHSVDDAIALMRDASVRRIPVIDDGSVVGVISLGDIARERERESVPGEISGAPANR